MADLPCLPEKSTRLSATYEVGGVQISAVNPTQAADAFFRSASHGAGGFVTLTSAHGIVEAQTDGRLRDILNSARMTLADGTPIAWIGTLRNPLVQRVSGARFFDELMHDPRSRHIRHYFYGGQPNCTSRVVARATELLGIDAIAGWHCPPFRPVGAIEEDSVIAQIVVARPDVIWVGLSTPKQEYWMANHTTHFPRTMLVGVGAAFDCFAGIQPRAPMIVQKMGLEWLYRLIQEPKRLWPRYRRVVPGMLRIFIGEVIRR